MLVYKDLLSTEELLSDTYKIIEVDSVALEVQCKEICPAQESYDYIGDYSDEKGPDSGPVEKVLDIVDGFDLIPVYFKDFAEYKKSVGPYLKKIADKMLANEESAHEISTFKTNIIKYMKENLAKRFDEYAFFMKNETDFENGMIVPVRYYEDQTTHEDKITAIFWKHGMSKASY